MELFWATEFTAPNSGELTTTLKTRTTGTTPIWRTRTTAVMTPFGDYSSFKSPGLPTCSADEATCLHFTKMGYQNPEVSCYTRLPHTHPTTDAICRQFP